MDEENRHGNTGQHRAALAWRRRDSWGAKDDMISVRLRGRSLRGGGARCLRVALAGPRGGPGDAASGRPGRHAGHERSPQPILPARPLATNALRPPKRFVVGARRDARSAAPQDRLIAARRLRVGPSPRNLANNLGLCRHSGEAGRPPANRRFGRSLGRQNPRP